MRSISEIAQDIRDHLTSGGFGLVRLSQSAASPQLLTEIRALPANRLPAVVIVVDSGQFDEHVRSRSIGITLVLVDKFVAGSDERALSVWSALDNLQRLFPPDSIELAGVNYLPRQFYMATADPQYVSIALQLDAMDN